MTAIPCPASWCEIHRDTIARNLELALGLLPEGSTFCAVLKGDAYGHSIPQVVPIIKAYGVGCVGITSNAEAHAVRAAGFKGVIIRLRAATPLEMEDGVRAQIEEQAGSIEAAQTLHGLRRQGHVVRAHLALNCMGMSRDGLEIGTDQGRAKCRDIINLLGRDIIGICTHFPCNQPKNLRRTARLFEEQTAWIFANSALERRDVLVHAGSSLTLVAQERYATDMYRCGAILYGVLKPELGFRTTMELKARVISIEEYPAGATVGYDQTVTLDKDSKLACVSVGYANGFRRSAYEDATITLGGRDLRVIGKVSMNTIVVDATALDDIAIGDEVAVLGPAIKTTAALAEIDRRFQTILADLYCDWGIRNQRIFC
jgi:alanine racemase